MGETRIEKTYSVIIIVVLSFFLGSIFAYYFLHHDLSVNNSVGFINDEVAEDEVVIDWAKLYPFKNDDHYLSDTETEEKKLGAVSAYLDFIDDIESRIDHYTSHMIVARDSMIKISSTIRNYLRIPFVGKTDEQMIRMKNGYLTYYEEQRTLEEIQEIADSLKEFDDFCSQNGVEFIYANAGSKVNPEDKMLDFGDIQQEFTNENGDALIAALSRSGIDVIDFRHEMNSANLDWYGSYYIADHHWKNTTGLWAAGVIADKLNKDYDFNYDINYFDINNYEVSHHEKIFLGGQGRAVGDLSYKEDFDMIIPKYDTDYTITIPTKEVNLTGDYAQTLVDMEIYNEILHYSDSDYMDKDDCYHISRVKNVANTVIQNNLETNNENKKILMLQDSFAWFLTGYLASDISQIDVIFPMAFDGSIRTYIEEVKPDVVIMLYCERNIKPIDWKTHKSQFDMR